MSDLRPVFFPPRVFKDERGSFHEVFHSVRDALLGVEQFKQANVVRSKPGVLRGMHYQYPDGQGKLVSCLKGSIYDVVLDIRCGSPTFRHNWCYSLSEGEGQVWIPPGFAHGYCVTGQSEAVVLYLCDEPYVESQAKSILYCDPDLHIPWPRTPLCVSTKDRQAPKLHQVEHAQLPRFEANDVCCPPCKNPCICQQESKEDPEKPVQSKGPVPALSRQEAEHLVDALNHQLYRLPRIIETLLSGHVVGEVTEINSAYAAPPGPLGTFVPERMLGFRLPHNWAMAQVTMADLLSVMCPIGTEIKLVWEQGRAKLVLV